MAKGIEVFFEVNLVANTKINNYLCNMKGMVLYRGANQDEVLRIAGRVMPYEEGMNGFIISGFKGRKLVILDERMEGNNVWLAGNSTDENSTKEGYERVFGAFHERLTDGTFDKIVLSRRKWFDGEIDILASFNKACELYKDQTVALISSEMTGTWLVATPELLLSMDDKCGCTMALAGTMKEGEGEWSEKNRAEQRVVADYIGDTLRKCSETVMEERPRTVRAGRLLHLRSDFQFITQRHWTNIVQRLHPTPAVCGMPAKKAFAFINDNEGYDRELYSGFFGLATEKSCLLFVTLRCAQIAQNGYWLYAGGGLMAESNAESEWKETENKMETIRRCLVTKEI